MKLLSPKKLAEELDVDVTTVYGWIARKQIDYFKIHNLVKFNPGDVAVWLERKKVNCETMKK